MSGQYLDDEGDDEGVNGWGLFCCEVRGIPVTLYEEIGACVWSCVLQDWLAGARRVSDVCGTCHSFDGHDDVTYPPFMKI